MPTVLATVFLDPPSALMAGVILALVSTRLLRKNGDAEVKLLIKFAAAWALIYGIAVGWPYFNRTDWMYVYVIDTANVPLVPTYLVFVFVLVGNGVIGAVGTAALIQSNRMGLAWTMLAATVIYLAAIGLITAEQYANIGTTAQWLAHTTTKLPDDKPMMMAVNGITVGLVLASVPIIVVQVRRSLKKA